MPNIFQSKEWAEFKVKTGYEKYYEIEGVFVLQKRLPLGRTMLYSPMVKSSWQSAVCSQEFKKEISDVAKRNNSIFYRLEVADQHSESANRKLLTADLIKAFEEMQPEHTLVLDISRSEEEILAGMKQKGRYNIKMAAKNGVVVKEEVGLDNFYSLYSTMAKRQKITYRDQKYYQALIDTLGQKGYVKILTGYVGQQETANSEPQTANIPIASAIISFYGDDAIYLFGGSSDQHRKLMAPYAVQWEAIKMAKAKGCKSYDFFGIAPDDNPNHPWAGVTRFKKQFGGYERTILGSYDLVFKPIEYHLFKIAEKARR